MSIVSAKKQSLETLIKQVDKDMVIFINAGDLKKKVALLDSMQAKLEVAIQLACDVQPEAVASIIFMKESVANARIDEYLEKCGIRISGQGFSDLTYAITAWPTYGDWDKQKDFVEAFNKLKGDG